MQNQQLSDVKGKELVAAGHALANAIGMDTPLIEIAKMVAELAGRLDCALARGDAHMQAEMLWEKSMMQAIGEDGVGSVTKAIAELIAQRDGLAAEMSVVESIHDKCVFITDDDYDACPKNVQEIIRSLAVMQIPATDAYLNSVRAEGIQILTGKLQQLIDEGTFDAKEIGVAAGTIHEGAQIAAQLRAGEPS